MKKIHKHLFRIANNDVTSILKSYRILRRINATDTIELILATDEQMGYAAGQKIDIELQSDTDIYKASFAAESFKKDGNTLTINGSSILSIGEKQNHYSLAESSKAVALRLGAASVDGYVDFPVSLSCEAMKRYDALLELAKITGAEVYEQNESLYIKDAKIITDTDTPMLSLHERREILSLQTSVSAPKTKRVLINISDTAETIYAKPSLLLAIDFDPHPVTPLTPIVYTKDTQTYTISPLIGRAIIYYSPLQKEPYIQSGFSFAKRTGYKVVEKFTLEGDYFVTLSGGISAVLGIELDGIPLTEYHFEVGHNVLAWPAPRVGELKISYSTDIYYCTIPPSASPKKIPIKAAHEGLSIAHTYKYDFVGYYPLPYTITLSLITDFGLDSNDAINAAVTVRKGGAITQNATADAFGELDIAFTAYGFYCLTAVGVTRYITIFANEYSISVDKPQEAVC